MQAWFDFLRHQGALIEDGVVRHFGDPARERDAARSGDVLMDLSRYAVIAAGGDDRIPFLHGQFTNDLNALGADRWQLHAYCNAKGRVLALLQIAVAAADTLLLITDRALRDNLIKRLGMFRLRAKVSLKAADDLVCLGLSGPKAGELLAAAGYPVADCAQAASYRQGTLVLGRQGPWPRFLVVVPDNEAAALWARLAQDARPVGSDRWDWLDIMSGQPQVTGATVESFVPQMLNLDLLDAINFKKGCYPGQEIVARTRYLGKLKSRMVRAWVDAANLPQPGTRLYAASFGDQPAGTVVSAAASPDGGGDLLAVAQLEVLEKEPLTLGTPGGTPLESRDLPYPLSAAG